MLTMVLQSRSDEKVAWRICDGDLLLRRRRKEDALETIAAPHGILIREVVACADMPGKHVSCSFSLGFT